MNPKPIHLSLAGLAVSLFILPLGFAQQMLPSPSDEEMRRMLPPKSLAT